MRRVSRHLTLPSCCFRQSFPSVLLPSSSTAFAQRHLVASSSSSSSKDHPFAEHSSPQPTTPPITTQSPPPDPVADASTTSASASPTIDHPCVEDVATSTQAADPTSASTASAETEHHKTDEHTQKKKKTNDETEESVNPYAALRKYYIDDEDMTFVDPITMQNPDFTDVRCPLSGTKTSRKLMHVTTFRPLTGVHNTDITHRGTVICLHGMGMNGRSMCEEFLDVIASLPHIKFVFPYAKCRNLRLLGGQRMQAWYNIDYLDVANSVRNCERNDGLENSVEYIHRLIDVERKLLAPGLENNIVVGGFSTGAALAILAAHTYEEQLAGAFSMSGYLTGRVLLKKEFSDINKRIPVFMTNGDCDPVIPLSVSKSCVELLQQLKGNTQYERTVLRNVYERYYRKDEHSRTTEEFSHIASFLQGRIPGGYELSSNACSRSKQLDESLCLKKIRAMLKKTYTSGNYRELPTDLKKIAKTCLMKSGYYDNGGVHRTKECRADHREVFGSNLKSYDEDFRINSTPKGAKTRYM